MLEGLDYFILTYCVLSGIRSYFIRLFYVLGNIDDFSG